MFRHDCPCPKKKCIRRGKCDECTKHHAMKDKLPYCKRPKHSLFVCLRKKR